MDPERISDFNISVVANSKTGGNQEKLFWAIGTDPVYLILTNGKDRTLDKPKRKRVSTYKRSFALRPESPKASAWRQSAQQRITKRSGEYEPENAK